MGLCKIGFAEPNTLWNYLVQYDNTNLRSIIYSQFDNNIMLTWFETNERSNFITHASSVAPGHVGTWQTSHAGHSKETYFNMVKTYYGQSAYDLLIQRYLNNTRTYLDSFGIAEWHPPVGGHGIYGSSRLGIYQSNLNLVTQRFDADVSNGSFEDPENISTTTFEPSYNFYTLQRGNKRYELSNHLGNVLAVISDRKLLVCNEYNKLEDFEGTPNLAGAWNVRDSWSGQNAVISLEDGKLSHANFDVKPNNLAKYRSNSCLVQTETNDINFYHNKVVWTITAIHAVLNIKDNITADPHARYNYFLGKDIPPNQSIRLSFDLEHVEGDHDWQVGIVYSTTENAYQGNMIYFSATSGHNEINFVTPGYFWRVRLLHIPTAQDMEFNLDNFHIENLTQDSASKCHAAVISATDYSPFGAPLPGRTYQASEYRFAFNGKEKDDETYGDGNAYDFGARIYDARLGKMFKVDPYFSVYPGLTPYSGFGGNPITNTDAGGKLIIFVSGYGPLRSSQSSLKYSRHWDVEMRQNAAATMDDYKAMYFTGSSKPFIGLKSLIKKEIKGDYDIEFTSAEMREDAGRAAVTYELAMIIKQQIDEQRITNPNAKINFVAHSMGVAYAAGMVKALLEAKDGEGNNIFSPSDFGESWLFAGYQSNRVDYPIVGTVNQRAHDNDKVAGNEEMRNYTTFQTKSWGNGELSTKAHGSETFLEYFEKTGTRLPETISKNGGTRKESSSKSNEKGGKGGDKTSSPPIRNVRNM